MSKFCHVGVSNEIKHLCHVYWPLILLGPFVHFLILDIPIFLDWFGFTIYCDFSHFAITLLNISTQFVFFI